MSLSPSNLAIIRTTRLTIRASKIIRFGICALFWYAKGLEVVGSHEVVVDCHYDCLAYGQ
jgi:uncharacterized membrane protein